MTPEETCLVQQNLSRMAVDIIHLPGCPWGSFSQLLACAIFDSITASDLFKASISCGAKGKTRHYIYRPPNAFIPTRPEERPELVPTNK